MKRPLSQQNVPQARRAFLAGDRPGMERHASAHGWRHTDSSFQAFRKDEPDALDHPKNKIDQVYWIYI